MIWSFFLSLFLLVSIGLSSAFFSRGTNQDYYLASANIKPWLVGLSAIATNNSGYMFIGFIGYVYTHGLAASWLVIGWIGGDFLASILVHSRLRMASGRIKSNSFTGLLSEWTGKKSYPLRCLLGLISLVFLLACAGGQLVAGSKAIDILFGWPTWFGALLGTILVVFYCLAGGIRASIWTDAAQSFFMMLAMLMLALAAVNNLDGFKSAYQHMSQIEGFLDWMPEDTGVTGFTGLIFFSVGWLFAGISVIGQPHIMIRFMTLNSVNKMLEAKTWYYTWYILFCLLSLTVGLLARVCLPEISNRDVEMALPALALELLPGFAVGLLVAGIFAATMSTADSLLLSCSAAITNDLYPKNIHQTLFVKLTTILVSVIALFWALLNTQSVFDLVTMAWSSLASAVAPLLIVLCLGLKPQPILSIAAVIVGLTTAFTWRFFDLHIMVYEGFPGMIAGFLIFVTLDISSRFKKYISDGSGPI